MYRRKKLIIEKKDASTTTDNTTNYTTDYDDSDGYTETTETSEMTKKIPIKKSKPVVNRAVTFKSIVQSNYTKPVYGSKQDNLTLEEIKEKLEGYVSLKSINDKKVLTMLPLFKTWVRYYNVEKKQFRTGGLLMKVAYPEYITLVNTVNNVSWSVQLKDVIIYILHPDIAKQRIEENEEKRKEKSKETQVERKIEKQNEKKKEKVIKDKLYELYKKGELRKTT
jgi:hypothetical protein|uniref:Uncharacterized protein n=1 Tax=viral metagenome TaxID=1070528 RepID=A0A6C0DW75_9ZZZZ